MLSGSDLGAIVGTALACTALVTGAALVGLRLRRRATIAARVTVIMLAAIGSITASTVAVVAEMFISTHDLVVLCWVIGVAALVSAAVAWPLLRRTIRRSAADLIASARQIGDGGVIEHTSHGLAEFDALSTELAQTSTRLAEARVEIQKLDEARRQFFAAISHDLRTPLTGIRALTEAVDDGLVSDLAGCTSQIRTKVDSLSSMVDDLFELSTLQSGTYTLHREVVTLLDLVSDAVVDVKTDAAARGITILQAGIEGHQLWADPRELTRAIVNLLSNSVRYAPDHTEIVVSAHTRDDNHLVLSVLDHGSGVDSEDLGHLFDVGWRADAARSAEAQTRSASGAGLGLAIVRGIAEAHGGSVHAETLPEGFRLDLVLPSPTLVALR